MVNLAAMFASSSFAVGWREIHRCHEPAKYHRLGQLEWSNCSPERSGQLWIAPRRGQPLFASAIGKYPTYHVRDVLHVALRVSDRCITRLGVGLRGSGDGSAVGCASAAVSGRRWEETRRPLDLTPTAWIRLGIPFRGISPVALDRDPRATTGSRLN